MKYLNSQLIIVFFLIFGYFLYFPSLFNGFVSDDFYQIVNNSFVHSLANIPKLFLGSTFSVSNGSPVGHYYRPFMPIAFTIIYSLFGQQPFYFHLFQITLHILNTILLYLTLIMLFSLINAKAKEKKWNNLSGSLKIKYQRQYGSTAKTAMIPDLISNSFSFYLALIFLVHPINTETVAYIADLQDILFFFFGILSFFTMLKNGLHSYRQLLLVCVFLFFSLLSKETGIAFIIILLFYVWLFYKNKFVQFLLTNTVFIGLYLFMRIVVAHIGYAKDLLIPIANLNLFERLLNLPTITFFYIKTFLFPKDLITYQLWTVKEANFSQFFLPLLAVVLFFGLLIYFLILLKDREPFVFKLYLFFFLWFVIGLGLHSQILPLEMTVEDRWFYFPLVGILGMSGIIANFLIHQYLQNSSGRNMKRPVLMILLGVLLIGFSLRTFIRTFDFKDNLTLYSHDSNYSPKSFLLENGLGTELLKIDQIEKAKDHLETSVAIMSYPTNLDNLGVYYVKKNNFQKAGEYFAQALAMYQKIPDTQGYYNAFLNYSTLLLQTKQYDKSANMARKGLEFFPNDPLLLKLLNPTSSIGNP